MSTEEQQQTILLVADDAYDALPHSVPDIAATYLAEDNPELLLPQQLDYQNLPIPIENFLWDQNRTIRHQRFKKLKQ